MRRAVCRNTSAVYHSCVWGHVFNLSLSLDFFSRDEEYFRMSDGPVQTVHFSVASGPKVLTSVCQSNILMNEPVICVQLSDFIQ